MLSCRGFDGRDRVDAERSVDGGGGDEDFEDEEVGKKETAAPRAGGGSYSSKCARACMFWFRCEWRMAIGSLRQDRCCDWSLGTENLM